MGYDKEQNLGSQCYDIFHLVLAGLTPEAVSYTHLTLPTT